MITSTILAVISVVMIGPVAIGLDRLRSLDRAPRAAVMLWQAVGLAGALAAIGSGVGLAVAARGDNLISGVRFLWRDAIAGHPLLGLGLYGAFGLTIAFDVAAVLACGFIASLSNRYRSRSRHRYILDLVSGKSHRAPGVMLLNDPRATAYYLPGWRPRIVVSSGALDRLDEGELSAVLDHETGHVHERHDLVMLPFVSLTNLLTWIPYARIAPLAVSALLEMAADDHSARSNPPRVLASALTHVANPGCTPNFAFGAASGHVAIRVARLLQERRTSRMWAVTLGVGAALAAAAPVIVVLALS